MKNENKILLIAFLGIAAIVSVFGVTYLTSGMSPGASFHPNSDGKYEYEITGKEGGAGSHTKSELIFSRATADEPMITDSVELTKDLRYTEMTIFSDWKIHTFENLVFVSWIASEQTWSDVFLAKSDDYGKTFDVENISQTQNYVYEYKTDFSDETVYLIWRQDFKTEENNFLQHIYFTKSDDFGESFGEQKLLSTFERIAHEFDLEAFGDNVFVTWREDGEPGNEYGVWFATSTDKAEWFDREAKLSAGHVDVDSFNDVLHFTWVSTEDDNQVWYALSNDLGKTLHSRVVFDADWELSPYAEVPIPKISVGDEIFIDFEMRNAEGEKPIIQFPFLRKLSKKLIGPTLR